MPKRRPYRQSINASLSNTTSETFKPKEPHDPRYVLYITAASMEDETAAPTTIAFGKDVEGTFTTLEEDPSPILGIRYHIEKTHMFMPGEEPAIRIEAGGSGNVISGYLEGYEEEI